MVDSLVIDSVLLATSKIDLLDLLGKPDDSTENGSRYYWVVDRGLKVGPMGLGGPWLFQLNVDMDTVKSDHRVVSWWISD